MKQAPPTIPASGGRLNTLLITCIALKLEWLTPKLKIPPNLRLGFNELNNYNSPVGTSCKFKASLKSYSIIRQAKY